MALPTASQSYIFYDAKQQSARMSMFLDNNPAANVVQANAQAIGIDLGAISNTSTAAASTVRSKGPLTTAPVPVAPGTIANYLDVSDKAVFVFQDAEGGLHKYQVPCPKSTIFQADQETIDYTVAGVKQFVADMLGVTFSGTAATTTLPVNSRTGVPLTASVGGYRRRGKASRRFNIYTRNAPLTGQAGAP